MINCTNYPLDKAFISLLIHWCSFSVEIVLANCNASKHVRCTYSYEWRNIWVWASTKPGKTTFPRKSTSGWLITSGKGSFRRKTLSIRPELLLTDIEISLTKLLSFGSNKTSVWTVNEDIEKNARTSYRTIRMACLEWEKVILNLSRRNVLRNTNESGMTGRLYCIFKPF